MFHTSRLILLLLFALCTLGVHPVDSSDDYDLLIRNARVLDGTGNPWYYADIAIRADRIVAMGSMPNATALRTIDAAGLYLSPGFVDVHSHAGGGLVDRELSSAIPLLAQGITTVVVNPDGGGPIDLHQQREQLLEFGLGVNVAQFVPFGSIRQSVLGMDDRAPDPSELEQMKERVRKGMEAGAIGLSSGLFYAPASYARTEEVVELAKAAAEYNGIYQSHIRDESDYTVGLRQAVEEVIHISREAGLPGVVTHIKALGPNVWGESETIVRDIERARNDGVEVYADQYPYDASSTSLSAALLPRWASEGGRERFLERLDNPDLLDRILREMEVNLARRGGPGRISVRRVESHPQFNDKTLLEIADEMNLPAVAAALRLLREGSPGIVSFNMTEEDILHFMQQEWTMTSSDGGLVAMGDGTPHPRNYGSFARKIALYVQEKDQLTLSAAIRSMTSLSASVHKIPDRGLIRPGMIADLVLFDLQEVEDHATYTEPHQLSTGFHYVLVNGEFAVDQGVFTESLFGRVLQRNDSSNLVEKGH